MGIAGSPRSPAAYLLVILSALLTMLSGPSAAAHADIADPGSSPHIEGLSPHGDEARARSAAIDDDPVFSVAEGQAGGHGSLPSLPRPCAAADALGPPFAVAASPWSGRSPPQARLGI